MFLFCHFYFWTFHFYSSWEEAKTTPVIDMLCPRYSLALLHVDDGQEAKEFQIAQPHQDPKARPTVSFGGPRFWPTMESKTDPQVPNKLHKAAVFWSKRLWGLCILWVMPKLKKVISFLFMWSFIITWAKDIQVDVFLFIPLKPQTNTWIRI